MSKELDLQKLDAFISNYPIYEYRLFDTGRIKIQERVRLICQNECERYGSTWACPPAVGTLKECGERIKSYDRAFFFSSVAEVSDLFNMDEMLSTRDAHEEITTAAASFLEEQGFQTFTLSTESCALCSKCTYPEGKPCRFPQKMHPCLESHGVVVSEIVEEQEMDYNIGGNTVLWFSMICFRDK